MSKDAKLLKRRVFLTGATGAMGLAATRELVAAGHEVIGTTRSRPGAAVLAELGAIPVEVDLMDVPGLRKSMEGVDIVAHFATSIPRGLAAVKRAAWSTNDALRREATVALMEAAQSTGVRRFIFESIALAYPDRADVWIDESEQLVEVSPVMQTAIEAEAMLERFGSRGGEALSLRFGRLYGPGRASEDFITAMRKRQLPIVGSGANFVSSIHAADVGSALVAALDAPPGVYNVVDDEPCTQRAYLEAAATALAAPPPRRIPEVLASVMLGHLTRVLTVSQRVSNRRFRQVTGWTPRYRSVAAGWPEVAKHAGEPVASIAS